MTVCAFRGDLFFVDRLVIFGAVGFFVLFCEDYEDRRIDHGVDQYADAEGAEKCRHLVFLARESRFVSRFTGEREIDEQGEADYLNEEVYDVSEEV